MPTFELTNLGGRTMEMNCIICGRPTQELYMGEPNCYSLDCRITVAEAQEVQQPHEEEQHCEYGNCTHERVYCLNHEGEHKWFCSKKHINAFLDEQEGE